MTLTDLVPSLDLCQQLKAAGFPQDTALAYYHQHCDAYEGEAPEGMTPDDWEIVQGRAVVCVCREMEDHKPICATPTAEEILMELPLALDWGYTETLTGRHHDVIAPLEVVRAFVDNNDKRSWRIWWCMHHSRDTESEWNDQSDGEQKSESLVTAAAQAFLWWKKEVAG